MKAVPYREPRMALMARREAAKRMRVSVRRVQALEQSALQKLRAGLLEFPDVRAFVKPTEGST